MKKPERIELSCEDTASLRENLLSCDLKASDKKLLTGILEFYIWLQWALTETRMSLDRLRKLFGFGKTTEKRRNLPRPDKPDKAELVPPEDDGPPSATADVPVEPEPLASAQSSEHADGANSSDTKKGHGRLPHSAYVGAKTVEISHNLLKVGDNCPEGCGGRLYQVKARALICLTGQGLACATRYLLERLRCALCGKLFTADMKPGVCSHKYDASLKAHIAVAKNYAGLPFYRIEKLQAMMGVPLSDAVQWELSEELATDLMPLFDRLKYWAAQGELVHHDDTSVRILSLIRENNRDPKLKRRGMFTTGIVSKIELFRIYLFISGRCHSGENIDKLMALRSPDLAPIMRMADALSCNFAVSFVEILCLCLAHGRRKFYEIYDYFPGECRVVIDALALVYHYDDITKKQNMTADQRLLYHQTHSKPILDTLHAWMIKQQKLAEPNGSLYKTYNYMLKYWSGLTRFLEVKSAPLDNNIIERALKIPIRARKNSLFYKTEHGAEVGGVLTSIIHTCAMAGENPIDYLISLQHNTTALIKNPDDWLPWNYRKTLEQHLQQRAA